MIFKSILFFAWICAISAPSPRYDPLGDEFDIEAAASEIPRVDRVCAPNNFVLDHITALLNTDTGQMRINITLWAQRNNLMNLPRSLKESAFYALKIAQLETSLFSAIPQVSPLSEYGAFPPVVNEQGEIVSHKSNEPLVGKEGVINVHGKAVITTAFHGFDGVKPLIALELERSATTLIAEINNFLGDLEGGYAKEDEQQLVASFERAVYGNLSARLRLVRLTKFFGHSHATYNSVPLLIAYLKWPGFPLERPVNFDGVLGASISSLSPIAAEPLDEDYDPLVGTEFDSIIIDAEKRHKRFKRKHGLIVAGEGACFSLSALSFFGPLSLEGNVGLGFLVSFALSMAGFAGEDFRQWYSKNYKTAQTPAEKAVLESSAPWNMHPDLVDTIIPI